MNNGINSGNGHSQSDHSQPFFSPLTWMIPQDLGEPKVASPDVRNLQLPSGKLT